MRYAGLPALLLLVACNTTTEEQHQVARYQHNAKLFFDSGKLDQAMSQIDKGLTIEPGNYQLRALRGAVLLQAGVQRGHTDHKLLDEALAQFEQIEGDRSMNRHLPYFVFYSALALQRDGMRHLGEAERLRSPAAIAADPDGALAKADSAERAAKHSLDEARSRLEVLLDRGDMARFCHFHLMQIAATERQPAEVIAHGKKYLEVAKNDLTDVERQIQLTKQKGWENELLAIRKQLRAEEISTREFLADYHNDRQQYEDARIHLDEMLRLDPSRSIDYYNRGRILRELGQIEASKADFRRFLATSTLPADSPKKTDAVQALGQ